MSGFTEAELEEAVGRLGDGDRLRAAEARVAAAAPALQRVLVEALAAGGWFGESHRSELERVTSIADEADRVTAVDTLLAEETRISMMVGVAVGWALADELGQPTPIPDQQES
ncbi:MAG: hypothetical protein KDB46_06855 [Solirubrobacterales bacterium]|nr:hypothetical protein [Solirubrobacterales bacterium]